jgi:hypothetical protein
MRNEDKFIEKVIGTACAMTKIKKEQLLSSTRKRIVADTRICLANVLRKGLNLTQHSVGEILDRDHASVHHYENEHSKMMHFNFYSSMFNTLMNNVEEAGLEFGSSYRTKSDAKYIELKQKNAALNIKCKMLQEKLDKYDKIKELMTL